MDEEFIERLKETESRLKYADILVKVLLRRLGGSVSVKRQEIVDAVNSQIITETGEEFLLTLVDPCAPTAGEVPQ